LFIIRSSVLSLFAATLLAGCVTAGQKSATPYMASDKERPTLIMTKEEPPKVVFRRGSHDTVLSRNDSYNPVNVSSLRTQTMETPVTLKAAELQRSLTGLQGASGSFARRLQALEDDSEAQAASYYALIGAVSADLQRGTTPGNPILVDRWNSAQEKLDGLAEGTNVLNTLAMDLSYHASSLAFLQESIKATFGLSGAVDEDHRKLTATEDAANREIVAVNRLVNKVNDGLSRRATFLRTERANLQTLSLGIANGDLFGKSLTNSIFKRAESGDTGTSGAKKAPNDADAAAPASQRKPLVVIRFDQPGVRFEQPMYAAVNQALEKYPLAKFDVVAVSQGEGNPARLALSADAARKNGEAVLRALTDMGLPMERVRLNIATAREVSNSEVRVYLQ